MSVSYVVDIASLILRGPHATMIVGGLSGWTQTTVNSPRRNPAYRTLFNMACLVLTVQAAGQAYELLGGSMDADLGTIVIAVSGMAVTYFLVNTVPIAIAIALTTNQRAWHVWKTDFASSGGSYLLGAATAYVVDRGDGELGLLADAAPRRAALVPDLPRLSHARRKRSAAGRDSRSRQRRHRDDGSAARDPRVQPRGRTDVRLSADEHPRPERGHAAAAGGPRHQAVVVQRVHDQRPGTAERRTARDDRLAGRRHRVPGRGHRRARRPGAGHAHHRVHPRHQRAASDGRTAAPVAEARSDRPAGRRRGARLQQHPHEHHGVGGPDADGHRSPAIRPISKPTRSSSRCSAAPG